MQSIAPQDETFCTTPAELFETYVAAVDRKDLDTWKSLFAREASYSVISRENYERGLRVAFILDDSRDRIEDRVHYIRNIWKDHFDEHQPRHIVSSARTRETEEGWTLSASFAIYLTDSEGTTSLLAVGEYVDRVVLEDGQARFKEKTCIVDTNVLPRYFVYPF